MTQPFARTHIRPRTVEQLQADERAVGFERARERAALTVEMMGSLKQYEEMTGAQFAVAAARLIRRLLETE